MKTRREFLATTIAAAALLTNSSGQTAALSGLSNVDETGRKDTASNAPVPGDEEMGSIAVSVGEEGCGRRRSVEKSKCGTFPPRLEIPQVQRDSHFSHSPYRDE